MLGVSADYLLGIAKNPVPISGTLTDSEINMIGLWRELNEEGQEAAEAMIRGLALQDIYKTIPSDLVAKKRA